MVIIEGNTLLWPYYVLDVADSERILNIDIAGASLGNTAETILPDNVTADFSGRAGAPYAYADTALGYSVDHLENPTPVDINGFAGMYDSMFNGLTGMMIPTYDEGSGALVSADLVTAGGSTPFATGAGRDGLPSLLLAPAINGLKIRASAAGCIVWASLLDVDGFSHYWVGWYPSLTDLTAHTNWSLVLDQVVETAEIITGTRIDLAPLAAPKWRNYRKTSEL